MIWRNRKTDAKLEELRYQAIERENTFNLSAAVSFVFGMSYSVGQVHALLIQQSRWIVMRRKSVINRGIRLGISQRALNPTL